MNAATNKARLIAAIINDPRWASVIARDNKADGAFYYSTKTTGIYCRPSCGSRRAKPENIAFHNTQEEAENAGFKPCKRCKPHGVSLQKQYTIKATQACRIIEKTENTIKLEELAKQVGLSPYHFHRIFKEITGLTPRQYKSAHREKQVRRKLNIVKNTGSSVTDAIFDAGYSSNSRFYEKSKKVLGMTPSSYRTGGKNEEIHFAVGECSLGSVLVASSKKGVCAILMGDDPNWLAEDLQNRFPKARLIGGDTNFEHIVAKVVGMIDAPDISPDLPLDVRGTAFQKRVWHAMCEIPLGETVSYTDIARYIGSPNSARAVARACVSNKLAVAIPCHRVIRNNGNMSGYRWGVERKRTLLSKESELKRNAANSI